MAWGTTILFSPRPTVGLGENAIDGRKLSMDALGPATSCAQAVLIHTAFTFRYSSNCWRPDSRP